MIRLRDSVIKRKVLTLAILPVAIVTLVLTLLFSIIQTQGLEEALNNRGIALTRQLAPASEYGVFSGSQNILRPLVEAVRNEADVRSVTIRNATGRILIHSGPDLNRYAEFNQNASLLVSAESINSNSRVFQAPIFQTEFAGNPALDELGTGDIAGTDNAQFKQTSRILGWVTVELSMQRTHDYQTRTWIQTTVVAVLILIFSAILALRMSRKITGPITQLKDAVHAMENGNLEIQVHTGVKGELQLLESGINMMAKKLKASHANLEDRVEEATSNLRKTLHILEKRNAELDNARHEAETANETKSAFLANISHEIRTPLNGIQGFLLLLAKTPITSTQREYIDKIDVSTKTLLTLINDILDFSKLEAAKISITSSEFDLRDVIAECVDVCSPQAQRKDLELHVIVDSQLPGCLIGGVDRIAQVIKNLVSNAVKFTNRGQVVVRAETVRHTGQHDDIRVSVTDTGIGIAAQDLDNLFQPFSQLEAGMDRSYGGTGLGLVITKSLVELMGGTIGVESTPNRGSCFFFTLPLTPCPHQEIDQTRRRILQQRPILLATRNPYLREALQHMCAHWDMQISDLAILKTRQAAQYDAIIIDAQLKNAAIQAILESTITEHINKQSKPCLILLKPAREDTRLMESMSSLPYTFTDQISRPVNASELANLLCRTCTGMIERRQIQRPKMASQQHVSRAREELHVLVADDNPINRQFLSTWLGQLGAVVDEVADGNEAVAHCEQMVYDLILMDLHMPKMDGVEAANWIREKQTASQDSPIIAITADATEYARTLVQDSAINDYVVKPLSEEALLHIIEKWCPRHTTRQTKPVYEQVSTQSSFDEDGIIDKAKGLQLASGNEDLWRWSIQSLADRLPEQKNRLAQAIDAQNFHQLSEVAHSIVGAAAYCGATRLQQTAVQLEHIARTENIETSRSAYTELTVEITNLIDWLANAGMQSR